MRFIRRVSWATLVVVSAFFALTAGCGRDPSRPPSKAKSADGASKMHGQGTDEATIQQARATLDADDRKLADAQEWCVVQNGERLGSMGAPYKLTVKDQTVFLCCKSCEKKALSDPDKTLTKLEELKKKKGTQTSNK